MLTAFRPGTFVSAHALPPRPFLPKSLSPRTDGIPRGGAPITQVRHQLGSLTRAAHAPSSLRAARGIGPVRVRLSASFSEALMQTQEIFGIGIG